MVPNYPPEAFPIRTERPIPRRPHIELDDNQFIRIRTFPMLEGIEIQVIELSPTLGSTHCSYWLNFRGKDKAFVPVPERIMLKAEELLRKLTIRVAERVERGV